MSPAHLQEMHMRRQRVPCYDIDLTAERPWDHVIKQEAKRLVVLGRSVRRVVWDSGLELALPLFSGLYLISGGRYYQEMKRWAKAMDVPTTYVLALNCSYELSHVSEVWNPLGCTSVVTNVHGQMVHARNMDWDLPEIGSSTCVYRCHGKHNDYISVGILGMVGSLSGMVPGKFSVTLNWAPPTGMPWFRYGPLFLLREVLETAENYREAVEILSETPISSTAFFTVCGKHSACVIERLPKESAIRRVVTSESKKKVVMAQANHFCTAQFEDDNGPLDDEDDETISRLDYSKSRRDSLSRGAAKARDIGDLKQALSRSPVKNEDTYQGMVFEPASGRYEAWAYY